MGAVGNLNYMQVLDFMLGIVGIDIARDDGRHLGLWPWESDDRQASGAAASLRRKVFGEATRERAVVLHSPAPEPEPEPPSVAAPKPEPPPPAPEAPREAAEPEPAPQGRSKVTYCVRCFGREYPPEALAAAKAHGGSPHDYLSEADKAWPARWCECWKARGGAPASSRP